MRMRHPSPAARGQLLLGLEQFQPGRKPLFTCSGRVAVIVFHASVAQTRGDDAVVEEAAQSMLAWEHSGFHVHHSVRLEADDALGMLQLARYAARAPIALERLQYDAAKKRLRLVSDKREGPTAGTHDFEPLEFLALLLAHVPDYHEILVRYSGAYSVRRRAGWRNLGILSDTRMTAEPPETGQDAIPPWPALRALRRRWAELLRRIFEVDPLCCPRCGKQMRIVAFILEARGITRILQHLRRRGRNPVTLYEDPQTDAGRAPP
jgi:Putative transposase